MAYYQRDDHNGGYKNSATPPYSNNQDTYAMHNMPQTAYTGANQQSYYDDKNTNYNSYYNAPTPASSEGYNYPGPTPKAHQNPADYQHIYEPQGYVDKPDFYNVDGPKKRSCCDLLCCGCCVCCPRWFRWIACIILLIIIGLGIAVGVLAAIFKTPSVDFKGIEGQPSFNLQGTTANISTVLSISVNNPNIESVTFEKIIAKAYYPNYHNISLGGGQKNDVHISSNAITNILFPFNLIIDLSLPEQQSIMTDLLGKCGFLGGEKEQISIDYDVQPTIKIIGIPITITVSDTARFPCPLQESDFDTLVSSTLGSIFGSAATGSGGLGDLIGNAAKAAGITGS
ncbi:hypothetical protein J3Q64DRAFT_1706565 [Phycomyces blakesleeanus]|uniref:Late embryogenesis abundant protein LEA-2 subgroup domain-containing protein n=1 Tax=Phycomyces blakesleeanus TaxID=4837 RepID=A0ABR3BE51_PHYBL